jgi:hypothetical protein
VAIPEFAEEPKMYEDPGWEYFKPAKDGNFTKGMRLAMIIGGLRFTEPLQDEVFRYPPIQVDVPRRPDFIANYVNMRPTDWSERIHGNYT